MRLIFTLFSYLVGYVLALASAPIDKLDMSNPVDRFLNENPEYLPDTVIVHVDLPKIKFNNNLIDTIVRNDIFKRLKPLKHHGKILLSLGKTYYRDDSLYYFNLITPNEPTSLEIANDSLQGFIGYIEYDNITVIVSESIFNDIESFSYPSRSFTLKLLRQVGDIRWHSDYLIKENHIKCFYDNLYNEEPLWREKLINHLNRMDEHDF